MTIVHIFLAALGIGFLIFIHELGHYLSARRQGMIVEVFSIGFGPVLFSWKHKDVRWQFCILPFGGYVKIAGMERKGALEPHQIAGGFYSKSAWARIKVALAGPFVNIAFAFLMFCVIWLFGGRERSFSQHTRTIGWVAPHSAFYEQGLRPGDVIDEINGKPFTSFEQLYTETLLNKEPWTLRGKHIDVLSNSTVPFTTTPHFLAALPAAEKVKLVMQSLGPAQFLLSTTPPPGSPIAASGMRAGDRLIWANGKILFSAQELHHALNTHTVLLSVQRKGKPYLTSVKKYKIAEYKLTEEQKGEFDDLRHDAHLNTPLSELVCIPYSIDDKGYVQEKLRVINEEPETNDLLKIGDRILAVDGFPLHSAQALLTYLQTAHALMIVKTHDPMIVPSWSTADTLFRSEIDGPALKTIIDSIGTNHPITEQNGLRILPATPLLSFADMPWLQGEKIHTTNALGLGIHLQDLLVIYNPSPLKLCSNALGEMWRTISAIFSGNLSPKWLAGPLGIVHVMKHSWAEGAKEAFFWLGLISLNLGIFNLLPLPILDGGHVGFAFWEIATRRRMKAKTLERLIIPFVVLFIAFFIYLTYHDILKLFK